MPEPLKILLGGVPFGCDNVGDEAIIEGVVGIVRSVCPDARLTVSTDDPVTARKLGVGTIPLLGFDEHGGEREIACAMGPFDVFIWSGATGLSDYPEVSARLMRIAQQQGCKTVLLGVGMNRDLNPSHYRMLPGRRRTLMEAVERLSGGRVGAVAMAECHRRERALRALREALEPADLVVLRDAPTVEELRRSGVTRELVHGADCALQLSAADWDGLEIPEAARGALESDHIKVGICISTQGQVVSDSGQVGMPEAGMVQFLDRVAAREDVRVVFVPMNPITDAGLAQRLVAQSRYPERISIVEGRYEPAEIVAVAGRLDVVISSRLHLLILSSISNIPLVGLSNGTKIDNFLLEYGLQPACHVQRMDYERLYDETFRMVAEKAAFQRRAEVVRAAALARIADEKLRLAQVLAR